MRKLLNQPLQRLAFVILLITSAALIFVCLSPSPVRVTSNIDPWVGPTWHDSSGSEPKEREIFRVREDCADGVLGHQKGDFENGLRFVDPGNAEFENLLNRSFGPPLYPQTYNWTQENLDEIRGKILSCGNRCDAVITEVGFQAVLASCGKNVWQTLQKEEIERHWVLAENFLSKSPWSFSLALVFLASLLCSLLYNWTLGPIVRWIREG